jgi:tetratricopeptide (TPR) repeat protein
VDGEPPPDAQGAVYDDAQRAEQMYREGIRRFENKDLMGAIQVWRDAVRLAPNNGEYNKRLGLALARNQRWHKEAEKHLLMAAKAETLNAEITNALGHIYMDAGLKKRAEAQFRKVLAYSPSNKDAIKGLEGLGIEYSFMSSTRSKAAGADTSKGSGSFLSKLGGSKASGGSKGGGGAKESVDPKVAIAVIAFVIMLVLVVAMWMGVF